MIEYLRNAASRYPDRIALADEKEKISYRELWELSLKVGGFVAQQESKDGPVGVWATRDIYTPVLFFGILCSGNYYVPLDPGQPEEKLEKIVKDCGMRILLAKDRGSVNAGLAGICHDLTETGQKGTETAGWDAGSREGGAWERPMYMVYTSGSTGIPKGVLKTHGAMVDFVEAFVKTFSFGGHEVIGNQTPFFFDASAKDLYLSLRIGATLEILPTPLFSFPVRLIAYMNERKVSVISWVPSALGIVTQMRTFTEVKPSTLKAVFFVGEVFAVKQLNRWREALPDVKYVNLYGSSEIAGVACFYEIDREEVLGEQDMIPLRKPFSNCYVALLADGKPVREKNVCGEIYIASKALAREYFRDPQKTAHSFPVLDLDGNGGKRYLRTGDMAHYDARGNLVFETRRDFQIKHMGHRIELGEIEAAALSLWQVEKCGCAYDGEKDRIWLFCELAAGVQACAREIQSLLKAKVSSYMLPGRVVVLDSIPLNANGKTDRQKLKNMIT